MRILIAEADRDTALSYRTALERRNHQVSTTDNGEDCLRIYRERFNKVTSTTDPTEHIQPFDAVVLDYEMPKINGMDLAKQILTVNPRQRIILATYVNEELSIEPLNQLRQVVELLQKPFGEDSLMDTIEDKEIYSELQKLDMKTQDIKGANFRHEQLKQLIEILRKLQLYHLFDYKKKQTRKSPARRSPKHRLSGQTKRKSNHPEPRKQDAQPIHCRSHNQATQTDAR
jgi:CheY-like chemotaxis protein